ncbi:MAG: Xaa-Pro dipeptidase [Verrucomicrobiota bacterium]
MVSSHSRPPAAKQRGIKTAARVLYADSERSADMLYATRFFVPDPFVFLEQGGRRLVVLSDLEVDRGRKTAKVDEVLALSEVVRELGFAAGASVFQWLPVFLKKRRVKRVEVPLDFPLGLARALEAGGVRVDGVEGMFWEERLRKGADELRQMRRAQKITAVGVERGAEVLKAATVGAGRKLQWGGAVLTSERLRAEIDSAVLRAGGMAANTIVAGGLQACDPHERGSGPLKAGELIILDVFPRDPSTGYFGDMTRTVIKGKASDAQRHLWETVCAAQRMVLRTMKPGMEGAGLHRRVQEYFVAQGFPTEIHEGRWRGFFHGTGHGLGLELHEEPRFSKTSFFPGQVLTVEPGLYWPGVGGARMEDVVAVTEKGVSVFPGARVEFEL